MMLQWRKGKTRDFLKLPCWRTTKAEGRYEIVGTRRYTLYRGNLFIASFRKLETAKEVARLMEVG